MLVHVQMATETAGATQEGRFTCCVVLVLGSLCFVHYGEVDHPEFTPAFYSLSARILISLWYIKKKYVEFEYVECEYPYFLPERAPSCHQGNMPTNLAH